MVALNHSNLALEENRFVLMIGNGRNACTNKILVVLNALNL